MCLINCVVVTRAEVKICLSVITMLLSPVGERASLEAWNSSSPMVFGGKIVLWITVDFLLLHCDVRHPLSSEVTVQTASYQKTCNQ
jgi:hypothetical protein